MSDDIPVPNSCLCAVIGSCREEEIPCPFCTNIDPDDPCPAIGFGCAYGESLADLPVCDCCTMVQQRRCVEDPDNPHRLVCLMCDAAIFWNGDFDEWAHVPNGEGWCPGKGSSVATLNTEALR